MLLGNLFQKWRDKGRKDKMVHWSKARNLETWSEEVQTQLHTYIHTPHTHTVTDVFLFWLIALPCTFHLQNIMKNKYVHLLRKAETADNPQSWRWALHICLLIALHYSSSQQLLWRAAVVVRSDTYHKEEEWEFNVLLASLLLVIRMCHGAQQLL